MRRTVEKLKWNFKPGKKLAKIPDSTSGSGRPDGTSGDTTDLRSHSGTEYSGPPSKSPLHVSFPDGIEVLYDCPDTTVDICFIHGLTGNRDNTWTAHGQSTPWPKTLLPPKLRKARILTYGYDAYVVRTSVTGSNRLTDHATNLLNDLTTDRACCNASSRPLIFVTHSLGGLVCKEAILLSRNNPEAHLQGIFNCTEGIAFMGTPHKGSWMADWAKMPASALGLVKATNKSLLKILETDDQFLESIQVRFWAMIRELREGNRRLEVTCFFEELPLPIVGKVVSKDSATFAGYSSLSIHANHRDMVRFGSGEDNGFKRLLGELIRWEAQISHKAEVHSAQGPKLSQLLQDCLKSLAFPEMDDRSKDIDAAADGTCEWLLRHETYRRWAICDRGLLGIKGKPGSGKSTLLRYALGNFMAVRNAGDRDFVLSFFFHGRGVKLQMTPLGLFRSLLHQVLRRFPNVLSDLVATFQQRRDTIGEPGEKWQWHVHELLCFFESSLQKVLQSRPVWLFIDALDECGKENAIDLIRELKSLLITLPPNGLQFRICFACRHYPILDLGYGFEICLERENRQDISTYIQSRLSESRITSVSTIPDLVIERAEGVSMWARLVVDQVLDLELSGEGLKRIEEVVYTIPPDLDDLYLGLVRSMGKNSASLKLIQWICFALRPLSLDELRWVMIVDANCSYKSLQQCQKAEDYPCDCDTMERRLKTLSRGLVETVPSSNKWVVQFIHQSVQDFFVEKGLSSLDGSLKSAETEASGADVAGIVHYRLSRTCMRYLAMEEIAQLPSDPKHILYEFPLLDYATTSWITHVKQSEASNVSQDDLLDYFAWPSEHLIQLWVRIYRKIKRSSVDRPAEGTNMIHTVSRNQLIGPLRLILQKADQFGTDIDATDSPGRTPLSWAAEMGHDVAVKLLLAKGVDADAKDNFGRTPLSWAAGNGHEAVVKLLQPNPLS